MPWTAYPSSALVHTGTTLDVFCWNEYPRGLYELQLQCVVATHNIRAYVRGSGDGGSGFLCGINGANLEIRKYTNRVAAGSPVATTPHNIAANEAFTLRIRDFADKIEATVLKTDSVASQVQWTTTDYGRQNVVGAATNVDGGAVLRFNAYELTSVTGAVSEVFFVVAGGTLYASYDGTGLSIIGTNLCAADVPVSADIWDGMVYIVGGGKAWKWDVLQRTLVPASAVGHPTYLLPGATTEGTTTATLVRQFRARMTYAGMDSESSNLYFSAITEPLQLNTGELAQGAAIVLGVARQATVYDVVTAIEPTSANTLLIGCVNSMFMLMGDPADAASEVIPVTRSHGVSGQNAIAATNEGRLIVHTPEGLVAVQGPGEPVALSAAILTEGIQYAREDRGQYRVTLIRDPQRHGLHVWLTKTDGTGHWFWYDEMSGGYSANNGGYWPIKFADGYEPLAATVWKGQVLVCTRNGRVLKFDESVASDNGVPFETRCPFAPLNASGVGTDVVVTRSELIIGNTSGELALSAFVAANPEDASTPDQRAQVWTSTITQFSPWCIQSARGPAVILTLSSSTGHPWWVEGGRVVAEEQPRLSMARLSAIATPSSPCGPASQPNTGPSGPPVGPGGGTRPTGGGGTGPTGPPAPPDIVKAPISVTGIGYM